MRNCSRMNYNNTANNGSGNGSTNGISERQKLLRCVRPQNLFLPILPSTLTPILPAPMASPVIRHINNYVMMPLLLLLLNLAPSAIKIFPALGIG